MKLVLYTADCTGNQTNCFYPHEVVATNAGELSKAIGYDHVCARFKDRYRCTDNFEMSTCLMMDCDNDHSDNPENWITPETMLQKLGDVCFALVPSRSNMKVKGEKSARPRFHIYFETPEITSADECSELKRRIHRTFPFFDDGALDAARFSYGCQTGGIVWNDGWVTIDEVISNASEDEYSDCRTGVITEGNRNNTLSRFAGRILKRYGNCERAKELFNREALKCEPPMEDSELSVIWHSAVKFFNKKIASQPGYVAPSRYNDDFARTLQPDDYSDIGQAKVLSREYADELVYTEGTDYLRFNGQYWEESRQQAVGAAEEFLDIQLQDAQDRLEAAKKALVSLGCDERDITAGGKRFEASLQDDRQTKAYLFYKSCLSYMAFVMKRRDMKYITSALQAAKPMLEKKISQLDTDEFLINTPGGTFDLRKGITGMKEHEPDNLITKMTAVSPGDEGTDLWNSTLGLIFCNDTELIGYVQQIAGLCAIGKVYVEALIIAYGEGSNGKSTFWNTISKVLGTYSGTISADALTVGCKRNVKPEMAELKGKRLIIASELEEGMRLNNSIVKQLCSTDDVQAEKKYKDPFHYTPSHTLVLYTNHLPRVGGNDTGIWRRLIVIPFNAKISGKNDIKNYSQYLYENAGQAVLKWILEGAEKIIGHQYHLTEPDIVKQAIGKYRQDNDWLGNFIEDECELDESYEQKSGEFYQEYRMYCQRNGEYTRGTADFYSALELAGITRLKKKCGNFVKGIRLKEEFLN